MNTWKTDLGVIRKIIGTHQNGKILVETEGEPFPQLYTETDLEIERALDTKRYIAYCKRMVQLPYSPNPLIKLYGKDAVYLGEFIRPNWSLADEIEQNYLLYGLGVYKSKKDMAFQSFVAAIKG